MCAMILNWWFQNLSVPPHRERENRCDGRGEKGEDDDRVMPGAKRPVLPSLTKNRHEGEQMFTNHVIQALSIFSRESQCGLGGGRIRFLLELCYHLVWKISHSGRTIAGSDVDIARVLLR